MPRAAPWVMTILLVIPSSPARAADPDPDPWLGRDKALHFGASAVLAGGGYAVSSLVLDARYQRLVVGGGFALAVGAAKELYDLSGHGDPSWRDFTWDAIGTVVGLAVAWGIDLAIGGTGDHHPLFGSPPTNDASVRGLTFHF